MLIVDSHLDLAYSALNDGRDLALSLADLRAAEARRGTGPATVTFPELKRARICLVFGTLFVRPAAFPDPASRNKMTYKDAAEAHRMAMAQMDYYHRLADEDEELRLVGNLQVLEEVVASHGSDDRPLLGIVPLMEGADPIREPEEAELWYERGVRLIGLAWDDTRYAAGAWRGGDEGLTKVGHHLLEVMADFPFILDLTHMSEKASFQALDRYEGPVVATHSNARALVPGQRQLSDRQIYRLGERDGVIGIVLYNKFLRRDHRAGDPRELVMLDHVIAHIDHICQILGDARHVGIGSDFDGGFSAADIPMEMDSVADLPLIAGKLIERGYEQQDVDRIMGENWLNVLRRTLP